MACKVSESSFRRAGVATRSPATVARGCAHRWRSDFEGTPRLQRRLNSQVIKGPTTPVHRDLQPVCQLAARVLEPIVTHLQGKSGKSGKSDAKITAAPAANRQREGEHRGPLFPTPVHASGRQVACLRRLEVPKKNGTSKAWGLQLFWKSGPQKNHDRISWFVKNG